MTKRPPRVHARVRPRVSSCGDCHRREGLAPARMTRPFRCGVCFRERSRRGRRVLSRRGQPCRARLLASDVRNTKASARIMRRRRALKRVGDRTDSSRARRSPGQRKVSLPLLIPEKPGRSRIPPPGSAPALCERPSSNAGEAGRLPSVASRAVLHVASGTASESDRQNPCARNNLKVSGAPVLTPRRAFDAQIFTRTPSNAPRVDLHRASTTPHHVLRHPRRQRRARAQPRAHREMAGTTRASSPPSPSRYVPAFPRSTRARLQSDIVTRRALDISIGSSPYRSRRSRRASRRDPVRFFSIRPKPTWRGRSFCFAHFLSSRLGSHQETTQNRRFGFFAKKRDIVDARQR